MEKTKALLLELAKNDINIKTLINKHRDGVIDTGTLVSSAILCIIGAKDDSDEDFDMDLMTW